VFRTALGPTEVNNAWSYTSTPPYSNRT